MPTDNRGVSFRNKPNGSGVAHVHKDSGQDRKGHNLVPNLTGIVCSDNELIAFAIVKLSHHINRKQKSRHRVSIGRKQHSQQRHSTQLHDTKIEAIVLDLKVCCVGSRRRTHG